MAMGNQGHAPCKTSSTKDPHDSQLLWVSTSLMVFGAPVYGKKEGATTNPGACLQHDERTYGRIGVLVGMWNIGSLNGKGGEVCEE